MPQGLDKSKQRTIVVQPPQSFDRSMYQSFPAETTVGDVLEQLEDRHGETWYRIVFEDGREEEVR